MNLNLIWYIILPGVVVHEISHLFAVWITPNVRVESVDLTSEVRHSGHYTIMRSMIISYIPLFFNTSITILLYYISENYFIEYSAIVQESISSLIIILGFIISISAIPSYQDAKTPLNMMRDQILTRRFFIIILLSPIYLAVSIPTLIFAYVSQSNRVLNILSGISYAGLVSLVYFGYIDLTQLINHLNSLLIHLNEILEYLINFV